MKLKNIRSDFPVLNDNQVTYLDSAASALTPEPVIQKIVDYYRNYSVNVFRGLYPLSAKATSEFESAREKVAQFINAKSSREIVFTRGTTESINFIAYAWGRLNISQNDEIVTTIMEHHSNFVPWQELVKENAAVLKIIDIDEEGKLKIKDEKGKTTGKNSNDQQSNHPEFSSGYKMLKQVQHDNNTVNLENIVTRKTKLVTITHVSNVLGTINPIKDIVKEVKHINSNCLVLVDGAQSVPHMKVDVQDLGCDFYVFSGHKMMGPTGIGVLWMKASVANDLPPFHFGGSMIEKVTLEESRYAEPPQKFEAGTPPIAQAIGLGESVNYMGEIGVDTIRKHELELTKYLLDHFNTLTYCSVYGIKNVRHVERRGSALAFNLYTKDDQLIHPHDIGDILGRENICVRVGHHCAMPLHKRLAVPASVRVSFHIYNTKKDVDRLIEGLEKVKTIFK